MKSLHNSVYPELESVLREFVAGLEAALGTNLLGAYLVGSLATGGLISIAILISWLLRKSNYAMQKSNR